MVTSETTCAGQGCGTCTVCVLYGTLRARDAELAALRGRLDGAEELLGRWMFWASGVAFKSTFGEEVEHETDTFLSTPKERAR